MKKSSVELAAVAKKGVSTLKGWGEEKRWKTEENVKNEFHSKKRSIHDVYDVCRAGDENYSKNKNSVCEKKLKIDQSCNVPKIVLDTLKNQNKNEYQKIILREQDSVDSNESTVVSDSGDISLPAKNIKRTVTIKIQFASEKDIKSEIQLDLPKNQYEIYDLISKGDFDIPDVRYVYWSTVHQYLQNKYKLQTFVLKSKLKKFTEGGGGIADNTNSDEQDLGSVGENQVRNGWIWHADYLLASAGGVGVGTQNANTNTILVPMDKIYHGDTIIVRRIPDYEYLKQLKWWNEKDENRKSKNFSFKNFYLKQAEDPRNLKNIFAQLNRKEMEENAVPYTEEQQKIMMEIYVMIQNLSKLETKIVDFQLYIDKMENTEKDVLQKSKPISKSYTCYKCGEQGTHRTKECTVKNTFGVPKFKKPTLTDANHTDDVSRVEDLERISDLISTIDGKAKIDLCNLNKIEDKKRLTQIQLEQERERSKLMYQNTSNVSNASIMNAFMMDNFSVYSLQERNHK